MSDKQNKAEVDATTMSNACERVAEKIGNAAIAAVEAEPSLVKDFHKVGTLLTAMSMSYAATLAMANETLTAKERRLMVGNFKALIAPELEKVISNS